MSTISSGFNCRLFPGQKTLLIPRNEITGSWLARFLKIFYFSCTVSCLYGIAAGETRTHSYGRVYTCIGKCIRVERHVRYQRNFTSSTTLLNWLLRLVDVSPQPVINHAWTFTRSGKMVGDLQCDVFADSKILRFPDESLRYECSR